MRAAWFVAALLTACIGIGRLSPAQAESLVHPLLANSTEYSAPIALPYHLNFLDAIRYIDAGMKYMDAFSGFSVLPSGEICFRQLPNSPLTVYDNYYSDWCAYPAAIGRIEARTHGIELWCRQAYPQCAHRLAYLNPLEQRPLIANSITIQAFPERQERAALQDLIIAMGGVPRAW